MFYIPPAGDHDCLENSYFPGFIVKVVTRRYVEIARWEITLVVPTDTAQ
jgi:hypothetical protein